ncbi:MAG: hypothetical protein ACOYMW_02820 [Candidatus Competibacteraceae bacterium]
MSHRIQITLEDNLWEFLQNIPKNARSQILKQAVADELTRQHRRQIANQMDELRKKLKPLPGNSEQWLREERDGRP